MSKELITPPVALCFDGKALYPDNYNSDGSLVRKVLSTGNYLAAALGEFIQNLMGFLVEGAYLVQIMVLLEEAPLL